MPKPKGYKKVYETPPRTVYERFREDHEDEYIELGAASNVEGDLYIEMRYGEGRLDRIVSRPGLLRGDHDEIIYQILEEMLAAIKKLLAENFLGRR